MCGSSLYPLAGHLYLDQWSTINRRQSPLQTWSCRFRELPVHKERKVNAHPPELPQIVVCQRPVKIRPTNGCWLKILGAAGVDEVPDPGLRTRVVDMEVNGDSLQVKRFSCRLQESADVAYWCECYSGQSRGVFELFKTGEVAEIVVSGEACECSTYQSGP